MATQTELHLVRISTERSKHVDLDAVVAALEAAGFEVGDIDIEESTPLS